MREWLQTRGRAILGLLSDLGGALALVVLAASLTTAAVAGAVLVTLDVFPQPFFTLLVLGIAFLAAGLTLHFLRGHMTPPAAVTPAPRGEVSSPTPNAFSEAAALQRQHDENRTNEETRNRLLAERRALRRVREELLDNKHRIERADEGETEEIHHLTAQHWREAEATLLELDNPVPHAKARQAYREIQSIENTQYTRDPANPNVAVMRDFPAELIESDMRSAIDAIDDAANCLSAAELQVPENP